MTRLKRRTLSLVLISCGLFVCPCQAQESGASPVSVEGDLTGAVVGVVIDVSTAQALAKAGIEVVETSQIVYTDLDGNFTLTLEPGRYDLRVFREGYQEQMIEKVAVRAKESRDVEIALSPEGMRLGEVDVVARTGDGATEIAMLAERKAATAVSDAISAREISRGMGGDAASVLQRVTGISVVQNQFVYVRGLGERYSNTVMNDALLPTTQPDRRVTPMDLIPSNLLDNVKVVKSFTPDQPGEFSGGLVKIQTAEFPTTSTLKVSTSYGLNSVTSFKKFMTYPGDRLDFLGFGTGRRSLPGIIPNERLVRGSRFVPGLTPDQLQSFGRSFENVWTQRNRTALPNQSQSISGGTTIGKLGLVGAFTYNRTFQNLDENRIIYQVASGGKVVPQHIYASRDFLRRAGLESDVQRRVPADLFESRGLLSGYQSSTNTVRIGGVADAAYRLTPNQKFLFKNFYSHDGTDEARTFRGWNDDRRAILSDQRLRYLQEAIYSGQLSGEHLLSALGDSLIIWRLTYSRATLDEPDTRESVFNKFRATDPFVFWQQGLSGMRIFNHMRENVREPAVDWSKFFLLPSAMINIKAGYSSSNRDRTFNSRRFHFLPRGKVDLSLSPEELFAREDIRPVDGFELTEETRPTDAYNAVHDLWATYWMGDVTIHRWRVIGGARIEHSDQRVLTFDPFLRRGNRAVTAGQKVTDILPSVGIVYALANDMNLRLGYSQTVARPQFRELSPFEFTDITGGRSTVGNPDLLQTKIRNFDVRWEWFTRPDEVLTLGFFYKNFNNPIEQVIEPTAQLRTSFRNAEGAKNWGLELEVRKNLGALWSKMDHLSLMANYTYVNSNIKIGQQDLSVLTTLARPLAGQSSSIFNGVIQFEVPHWNFEARALINYVGRRISDVGAVGLPDIFEEGIPSLDLLFSKRVLGEAKNLELKFTAANLINRAVSFTQGGHPFRTYKRGRTFSIGISYKLF